MSQQFELSRDNITKRHHVISLAGRFYDDVPEAEACLEKSADCPAW